MIKKDIEKPKDKMFNSNSVFNKIYNYEIDLE